MSGGNIFSAINSSVGYGPLGQSSPEDAAILAHQVELASGQSLSISQRLDLEALMRERLGTLGTGGIGSGYDLEQDVQRILDQG